MAGDETIGSEQRDEANAHLRRLWESHQLDPSEHERRTTAVRQAQTRAEFDAAMADLPVSGGVSGPVLSGPVVSGTQAPQAGSSDGSSVAAGGADSGSMLDRDDDGRTDGLIKLPRNTAGAIMALTPLVAVVLFFVTGTWLWFLAIPMVAIVLFGPDGKDGGRRERRDRRREH